MNREFSLNELTGWIHKIYTEIDNQIHSFKESTGIRCPDLCGVCCESRMVEASILECLPLAEEIYKLGEELIIADAIEEQNCKGDQRCILFRGDRTIQGNGRCGFYNSRPLVCRLFGFAARRNKFGEPELALCRIVKKKNSTRIESRGKRPVIPNDLPVYQDVFLKIASLSPGLGFRLLPLNSAIMEALSFLYWKRPRNNRFRKAA